jgi:hypothetical protein
MTHCVPRTKDEIRVNVLKAMTVDASGEACTNLVMTLIELARTEGVIQGVDRSSAAMTRVIHRWSQQG